jgi:hypothetical protein
VPETLRNKRVFRLSIEALAKGAKSSDEFSARVQAVFAEAAQAEGRVILFVDQLNQYAGARATALASAAVKNALEANQLHIIGGASPQAYTNYIASDDSVAKLFDSISIDHVQSVADARADKRRSPINEEFEGEKISPDMRDLMKSAHNGRVTAILQVNDVNGKEVRALLAKNGVLMTTRWPARRDESRTAGHCVEALMKHSAMNYISPESQDGIFRSRDSDDRRAIRCAILRASLWRLLGASASMAPDRHRGTRFGR